MLLRIWISRFFHRFVTSQDVWILPPAGLGFLCDSAIEPRASAQATVATVAMAPLQAMVTWWHGEATRATPSVRPSTMWAFKLMQPWSKHVETCRNNSQSLWGIRISGSGIVSIASQNSQMNTNRRDVQRKHWRILKGMRGMRVWLGQGIHRKTGTVANTREENAWTRRRFLKTVGTKG